MGIEIKKLNDLLSDDEEIYDRLSELNIPICAAPVRGSTFITREGWFVNLKAVGYNHDAFLAKLKNVWNCADGYGALDIIKSKGWIRCNDGVSNGYAYLQSYDNVPTKRQYSAIAKWADNAIFKQAEITVIIDTVDGYCEQTYQSKKIIGWDIVNAIRNVYKNGVLSRAQKTNNSQAYPDNLKRQPTICEMTNENSTVYKTRFFDFKEGDVVVVKYRYRPEIKYNKYAGYLKYIGPMDFIVSLIEDIEVCNRRPFFFHMHKNGFSYCPCKALNIRVSSSSDLCKQIECYKDYADVFVVHYLYSNLDLANSIRLIKQSDALRNKVVIIVCEVTHVEDSSANKLSEEQRKEADKFNDRCNKYDISAIYELNDGVGSGYSLLNVYSGE
ncbi:MAG: hypothetical protein K2G31_04645, partial [Clostridia bacterium]|nr:hypothetical protein [Clostridia bacterium]